MKNKVVLSFSLLLLFPFLLTAQLNKPAGHLFIPAGSSISITREVITLQLDTDEMIAVIEMNIANPGFRKEALFGLYTDSTAEDPSGILKLDTLRVNGSTVAPFLRPSIETPFYPQLQEQTDEAYMYLFRTILQNGSNKIEYTCRIAAVHAFESGFDKTYYPFSLVPANAWGDGGIQSLELKVTAKSPINITINGKLSSDDDKRNWKTSGDAAIQYDDQTEYSRPGSLFASLQTAPLYTVTKRGLRTGISSCQNTIRCTPSNRSRIFTGGIITMVPSNIIRRRTFILPGTHSSRLKGISSKIKICWITSPATSGITPTQM